MIDIFYFYFGGVSHPFQELIYININIIVYMYTT